MTAEEFNYLRLITKDLLIMIAALGVSLLNRQVKKYDEMHRKEYKLARTDKLTGLANRHYFDQKLKDEVEYADRNSTCLNILIFDIDNFKQFNDSYGHLWGDKLLALFSDIIKQNIRSTDIPVRYGGEEFLLVIRDLDLKLAKSVGERIRRSLERQRSNIEWELGGATVSVSGGLAQYPMHSSDIKEIINFADKALYFAKENGKNKIVSYDELILDQKKA